MQGFSPDSCSSNRWRLIGFTDKTRASHKSKYWHRETRAEGVKRRRHIYVDASRGSFPAASVELVYRQNVQKTFPDCGAEPTVKRFFLREAQCLDLLGIFRDTEYVGWQPFLEHCIDASWKAARGICFRGTTITQNLQGGVFEYKIQRHQGSKEILPMALRLLNIIKASLVGKASSGCNEAMNQ